MGNLLKKLEKEYGSGGKSSSNPARKASGRLASDLEAQYGTPIPQNEPENLQTDQYKNYLALYDKWNRKAKQSQKQYDTANAKARLFGDSGYLTQGWDFLWNKKPEKSTLGHAEGLYDENETGTSWSDFAKSVVGNAKKAYEAWQKKEEDSANLAWIESQKEYQKDLSDSYGSKTVLRNRLQNQINKAQKNGDTALAEQLQIKLNTYTGYWEQEEKEKEQAGWTAEWDASQQGYTAFDDYQAKLSMLGGYDNVGKSLDTMGRLNAGLGTEGMSDAERAAREADADRYYSQYGDIEGQYNKYGNTVFQRDAGWIDADDAYQKALKNWEDLDAQYHNGGTEIYNSAYSEEQYNQDVADAEDYAWEMYSSKKWTEEQYDSYIAEQTALADQKRLNAQSGVVNSPDREALAKQLEEAAKELEKAKYIRDYAKSRRNGEADAARGYASFFGDSSFTDSVKKGKQAYEEYNKELGEFPTKQAQEERDRRWQEEYDRQIEMGADDYNARIAADSVAETWAKGNQANSNYFDPKWNNRYLPTDDWTEEEKDNFYWYFGEAGPERAFQYGADVFEKHNREKAEDKAQHRFYEQDRIQSPFARWARAGGMTALASVERLGFGTYDWLRMASESMYNDGYLTESQYQGLSRDADNITTAIVNEIMRNKPGTFLPESLSWVPMLGDKSNEEMYQMFSSSVDSMMALALTGGNSAAINTMFFGSAASSTMREDVEKGINGKQAAQHSFGTGVAEGIGETLSLELLLHTKAGQTYIKGFLKTVLTPAVEGSEEVVTDLIDRWIDDRTNGAEAAFDQNVQQYIVNNPGMTYEQARQLAEKDWHQQLLDSFEAGTLSMLMTVGAGEVPNVARTGVAAVTTYKGDAQALNDLYTAGEAGKAGQKRTLGEQYMNAWNNYVAGQASERFEKTGKMSNYSAIKMAESMGLQVSGSVNKAREKIDAFVKGLGETANQMAAEKRQEESTKAAEERQNAATEQKVDEKSDVQVREVTEDNYGEILGENRIAAQERDVAVEGEKLDQGKKDTSMPEEGEGEEINPPKREEEAQTLEAGEDAKIEQPGFQSGQQQQQQSEVHEEGTQEGKQGPDIYDGEGRDEEINPPKREEEKEETKTNEEQAQEEQTQEETQQPVRQETEQKKETETQKNIKQAREVLDFLNKADDGSTYRGMSRAEVEKRVMDLAQKFGLDINKPGLKFGSNLDAAKQKIKDVLDALDRIEQRAQERNETRKRNDRQRNITKENAVKVDLDDGSYTVTDAVFKDGETTFKAVDENGRARVLKESELSGELKAMYELLQNSLGRHAAEAFNLMNPGQSAYYFATDFRTMREAGMYGANFTAAASRYRGSLTTEQAQLAYNMGQGMTRYEKKTGRSRRGTGRVTMDGGVVDGHKLQGVKNKEALRNSRDFKEVVAIAKALDIDVVFYESRTEGDRYVGAQGMYDNGTIYLDVNAGMDRVGVGKRMFATTLSHELTHFIAQNAPTQYQALQDRVEQYLMMESGENLSDLVRSKMARSGERLSYDAAMEEVIADACETMLFNSQAVQELAQEKPGLFNTIKGFIDRFCNQILARHAEAKAIQPIIKDVQKLWDDALKHAVENRGLAVENPGDAVNEGKGATTNDATGTAMASLRTFDESGRDTLNDFLNKRVGEEALTREEAREIMDQIDFLYSICKDYDNGKYAPFSAWSNAEVVTYDGRPVFSVVKANGEYKLNLDFSLVCKKRRTLDAVFNEMISQGIMDDFDMVQESIAKINDIIRENGFETACGLCFVDSKRYRQGMIADAFVMMYNTQVSSLVKKGSGQKVDYFNYGGDQTIQNSGAGIDTLADEDLDWKTVDEILKTAKPSTVKWKIANYLKNNPSARKRVRRGDFMSTAGFDALNAQNPELLSLYNSKKGAGGPKAAQSDVQYLNEIIGSKSFNAKAAYEVGGVRIQSFSDYVGRLVFDYVQMVADLSAKQLPAHSYTKEYMFAQQFGLTGIKINMSLVPEIIEGGVAAGLDANGNYAWKDGQSFGSTVYDNNGKRMTAAEGFELAKKIQNAKGYSRNCGTIAVGVSDEHINKMLDDPEIRMIIPYHKSSLNHIVAAMMNIDRYTDYTLQQNTREWNGKKWVNIARSGEFNFNEALQRLGDAKAAANEYLDWCKENGYKPKFDQFAGNPNYYKLLEDYSCYDKDGTTNAPMGAVQMRFPTENDAFGSMKDLIAEGLEEDAILQAKQEKAVPEIVRQIQEVLPEFEGTVRERNAKKKKAAQDGDKVKRSDRDYTGVEPATRQESLGMDATDPRNVVRYMNEVTAALDKTMPTGDSVLIGKPSDILAKYLKSTNPIRIPQSIVRKAVLSASEGGKHGLGRAVVDELPYQFADPLAITGNTTQYENMGVNSIVVWTNWMTEAGDSIIVPIHIDIATSQGVFNNVSSEFDVYDEEYAKDLLRDGNILYTKENRGIEELQTTRRLRPEGHLLDTSRKNITNPEAKVKSSMRDDARTDRELLMESEAVLTEAEKKALAGYQARVRDFEERERKVQAALEVLDRMVREHDPDVQKQRSKVSNLQAGMQKALRELTQAEQGKTLLEIIRKEREIQRKRTAYATRETFTKRELRGRITKLYNDLNRRITNPSEKKNIPVPVMMQAVEVLEAINMDSSREGSKAGEKLRNKLMELNQKYKALEKDPDFKNAAVYDPVVAELLNKMVEDVGDTPINRMSASQMRAVYEALTALDKTARKALKVKMMGEERDAYQVSKQMGEETRSVAKPHKNLLAQWVNAQLSPERMFNRLGGYKMNGIWNQVYQMLDGGQLRQLQIQMEGTMLFDGLLNGKDYDRFIDPKSTVDVGLKDENGKVIPITRGMMVALYLHLQNEQNVKHIQYGGLTVPNLKDYYNRRNNSGIDSSVRAVGVSQELAELRDRLHEAETDQEKEEIKQKMREAEARGDAYIMELLGNIERQLTDYDRQWIAAAKELFDVYSKQRINETTMDVYGIKRANVENYFPIWVDGDFLNTPFESIAKDMNLENVGFMKERVESSKPIRLADVSDVASTQIRRVSQYCGLMPVVRNFQKIWGKVETGYRGSLQSAVRDKFGTAGIQYIENLMADLNGARHNKGGPLDEILGTLRGHMARASLTLSLRTAMGQAASYPTAASVIGWDPLRKALGQHKNAQKRAELIQKYSPLMWYRMKGYSTTELGDIAGSNSKFDRLWKKAHMITGWIQAADVMTVGKLWDAAEIYVADRNKALQRGSDAFYQEVAKVFNEIVEKSQPNYTTMQRPDILRNPSTLVRQLTMFLTQRLQNFNILYDSAATYSQARQDFKAGKVTAQQLGEARRGVTRAVGSQLAAAATIVAFKYLADVILHSMNAYRDDDKEITDESVSKELLDMFFDSLAGNMLGGGEIYDLIEKYAFGKTYYGIDVAGLSVVTDMIDAANKFTEAALKDGATPKEVWNKAGHRLAQKVATVFGIPMANAEKIVNGLRYHAEDIVNGEFLSMEAGVERTTAQQAHRLYRAYTEGNYGTAKKIREQVGDEEKLNAAMKEYVKQQYKDGKITKAQAQTQLVKWAGERQADAEKTMREYSCLVETGIAYSKIGESFVDGKITAAQAKKMLVKYGEKSSEDAEKMIEQYKCEKATGVKYSQIDDDLRDGRISEAKAAQMWVSYGGMDKTKAEAKASFVVYQGKNPNTTLESSSYLTWYTKYRSILTASQYEGYYNKMKDCKGKDKDGDGKADAGTVKKQKLKVIDSLPISNKEKDELYLINGWSKNTIKEAPWHK